MISPTVARGAVAAILNIDWFLVPYIPITQYREAQNQAVNIGNWLTGNGELQMETAEERQQRDELEWIMVKERMAARGTPLKPNG